MKLAIFCLMDGDDVQDLQDRINNFLAEIKRAGYVVTDYDIVPDVGNVIAMYHIWYEKTEETEAPAQ